MSVWDEAEKPVTEKGSVWDRALAIEEKPNFQETPDEAYQRGKDVIDMSVDFALPIDDIERNYDTFVLWDTPADPSSISDEALNYNYIPNIEFIERTQPSLRAATEEEIRDMQKRPPLPKGALPIEKFDRLLHIIGDPALRIFYKLGKGMLLNSPDAAFALIKKMAPEDMQEVLNGMTLDEAVDWAMDYNPGALVDFMSESAEFIGSISTVGKLIPKVGPGVLPQAARGAVQFGGARGAREAAKLTAELVDPDTSYGYTGAKGVAEDMAIGAGLSFLGSAAKPVKTAISNTAFGRAIEEGAHKAAVALTRKFPLVMDTIRKDPQAHFTKQVLRVVKDRTGKSTVNMTITEKAAIKHVAREGERRFLIAQRNYLKNVPPDVVQAVKRRGLALPEPTGKAPVAPVEPSKPIVPVKPPSKPVKPIAKPGVPTAKPAPPPDVTPKQIAEVAKKLPEAEISQRPVTVSGKKFYPVTLPTEKIGVDPKKFQFKLGAKLAGGVTEALKDVEAFDPVKAGQILVWQDKSGKYWVVDGHHRVALAKKTGAEKLQTWVLREADGITAAEARATGALRNLADGKGTAVDAAKLFRDSGMTMEDLRKSGVPTNSTIVKQGMDMKNLSDYVFRLVVDEKLPASFAAPIGKQVKGDTQQRQVADLILEGEIDTVRQAELLAATIDTAPVLTTSEQTLFGLETTEKSLFAERAKVLANVEKRLKTNKKVFGTLATQTGIIEAKGNILKKVENLAAKEQAEEVLFMLEKLANSKGPIAEALNDATKDYAKNPTKENLNKVTSKLLQQWTEGTGRLRIPGQEGLPKLPLERAGEKVAEKPVEHNFTTFAREHGFTDDFSVLDHGQLSPSGKQSKRAHTESMRRMEDRIESNKKGHEAFRKAILAGEVIDIEGKVTKEGLLAEQKERAAKKVEGRLSQIRAQTQLLRDTGKGKKGTIRSSIQKQIDALEEERKELLASKQLPPIAKPLDFETPAPELFTDPKKPTDFFDARQGGFVDITPLAKAHETFMSIIEPSKAVEIAQGKDVYAEVIKATHKADVAMIDFNEKQLENLDMSLGEWGKALSKYSNRTLELLMLSRGKPASKSAILIRDEALEELAKKAPELVGTRKMINRVADFNWDYLTELVGDEVGYVEDYHYGIYKDPRKVEKLLDHWKTTKRFLKEKRWPTFADAKAFDPEIELRDPNPMHNMMSEYLAIARLDGMIGLKTSLMKSGEGDYIAATADAPIDWDKVNDPVFADVRVAPELAHMINSLISTNRITRQPLLNTVRQVNNFLRTIKFVGSAFHLMVEAKQSLADSGYLGFLHKRTATRGLTTGFKQGDPIFQTPEYKDYIAHGGGHRFSIDSEAQRAFSAAIEKMGKAGGIAKGVALPFMLPEKFVRWMFENYIPKVKYSKYLDTAREQEVKLERSLTSAEKIDIIKEQQNFYGMMNERLFGRSGTVTTLLRMKFMAPGFAEGNFRSMLKAILQWGGDKGFSAHRSRANIINSFIISAIAATATTLILTGKPPKKPEKLSDIRDIFKADTGQVDQHGRPIMIDMLTYDKDYWEVFGNIATGQPVAAAEATIRRLGGMTATTWDVLSDLNQLSMGRAVYDWKGDRVVEVTDPFLQRILKISIHELKKAQPISTNVFQQARKKGVGVALSAAMTLGGVRLTKTEQDKKEVEILHKIFSLRDQQETLFWYLGTIKNPREHIKNYNQTVMRILDNPITPLEVKDEYEPKLIIDEKRLVSNKVYDFLGDKARLAEAMRSPKNRAKDIKELQDDIQRSGKWLRNFEITERQYRSQIVTYEELHRKIIKEIQPEDDRDALKKDLARFYADQTILKRKIQSGLGTDTDRRLAKKYVVVGNNIAEVARRIYATEDEDKRDGLFDRIESVIDRTKE